MDPFFHDYTSSKAEQFWCGYRTSTLNKLLSFLYKVSHPLHDLLFELQCTFNNSHVQLRCSQEWYRRSFLPTVQSPCTTVYCTAANTLYSIIALHTTYCGFYHLRYTSKNKIRIMYFTISINRKYYMHDCDEGKCLLFWV